MNTKYYKPREEEVRPGLECLVTFRPEGFKETLDVTNPNGSYTPNYNESEVRTKLTAFDIHELYSEFGEKYLDHLRVRKLDEYELTQMGFEFCRLDSYFGKPVYCLDGFEVQVFEGGFVRIERDSWVIDYNIRSKTDLEDIMSKTLRRLYQDRVEL